MAKLNSQKNSLVIVLDFALFVASFFLAYYAVIQTPHFLNDYKKLLFFEIAVWFFTFIFYQKNTFISAEKLNRILEKIIKSNVFFILSVSLLVVFLQLPSFSYWYILLHALFYAVFEVVFVLYFRRARGVVKKDRKKKMWRPDFKRYSPQAVVVDFVLLLLAFVFTMLWKFGQGASLSHGPTLTIFGIVTCLWFFSGLWSKKFRRFQSITHASIYHVLGIYMTSTVMLVSLASFLIVLIEDFQFSRMLLLAPAFFLFLLELPAALFRYHAFRLKRMDMDIITSEHVNQFLQQNKAADQSESKLTLDYIPAKGSENAVAFIDELKNTSDKNFIYDFIRQFIDLTKIGKHDVRLYSDGPGKPHTQPVALVVHETPLSSVKYFNRYLLELHTVLYDQGYLVCCVKSSAQEKKEVFLKYPGLFAFFFFFFDYSFHRILPKLPFFNSVYHVFFSGHLKYLTRTETLGRLAFCGFHPIAEQEEHGYFYFIAQKKANFHQDRDPIYGPLIKLKRVGYGGRLFHVYKLRTMHAYSEFIQDYVYSLRGTSNGDKADDDFRIPYWGHVLRKLWLDELPMLYNLILGDLKFVGVRPLSLSKFQMYPPEMQELRMKAKPGLIPPFYADMPDSFADHMASEKQYIESYLKKPFATDLAYLYRALYQIFVKKARSK